MLLKLDSSFENLHVTEKQANDALAGNLLMVAAPNPEADRSRRVSVG